ncbi:MAG: hypothetical protein HYX73_04830 [Acidobacteria bacterium]|nr:hypothetical protein [Acidobacteriota bacterium]
MSNNLKRATGTIFCLLLLLAMGQSAQAQLWADMVLYNGKVLTADNPNPANFTIAEAVAVFGDRIVGVGSSQDMLKLAGPRTQRIDLDGRTLLPGRIDTHDHIMTAGGRIYEEGGRRANVGMTHGITWSSKEDALAQIRTITLGKKPGEWVVIQPTFTDQAGFPNVTGSFVPPFLETVRIEELDAVTPPGVPLMLATYAYDDSLVNSAALAVRGRNAVFQAAFSG